MDGVFCLFFCLFFVAMGVLKYIENIQQKISHVYQSHSSGSNSTVFNSYPLQMLSGGRFLCQRNVFLGTYPHIPNSVQSVFHLGQNNNTLHQEAS